MRRGIDIARIRESMAAPGMDQRCWVCMGRIDDDPDAAVWDDVLGWLCDVTAVSGPLAGSLLPLACRVVSIAQGDDSGIHSPPRKGGLVVVMFPSGDPNEDSIIVGSLHNTDDAGAPATVNGEEIDEDFAAETFIYALPDFDLEQEWRNARITAGEMILGKEDADQPYMRGDDFADAIEDIVDAIGSFAQSIATATAAPPNAALTVADVLLAYAPLEIAIVQFKGAREGYLSTRIKGD